MKAAVVGLGIMGKKHIKAIQLLGLNIVGLSDLNGSTLIDTANEFNISSDKLYDDFCELLTDAKPELLVIATTAPGHCALTCLAAESGVKYILCEKPMAVSVSECNAMIETCAKYGTKLAINHQMRFLDHYIKAKEIIKSEEFGGLASITVLGGNIGLAMNATHYFEMFRYITDELPHEVTAWLSEESIPNPRGIQFVDKGGSLRAVTESGIRLYIEIGTDQGYGKNSIFMGKYGQLAIDELAGKMYLTVRNKEFRTLPTTRYGAASTNSIIEVPPLDALAPTKAVIEALINSGNYPTGEEGRNAVMVVAAAHISNDNGNKAVLIDELKNNDRKFPWA